MTASEAAEAKRRSIPIAEGTVTMAGNVLLTQGPSAISGDRLTIDLVTGSGTVEGRVRTTLQAGGGN